MSEAIEQKWKYTSEELNEKIRQLEEKELAIDPEGNGKAVPYMGWFWREVDFDRFPYRFGTDGLYVAFMQSNKWGYQYARLLVEQSHLLRTRIEALVDNPTKENCKAVYALIQIAQTANLPEETA